MLRSLGYWRPLAPNWDLSQFQFTAATLEGLMPMHGLYDASDPDLSAFARRRGKPLIWHGWSDPLNSCGFRFVPTSVRGFTGPLPASGPVTFELLGDLTVHGSTHPAVWQVTAHSEGQDVAGSATTAFTFKDINLDQPKVPVVLSVADTIKLEYDFRFARAAAAVAPAAKKP